MTHRLNFNIILMCLSCVSVTFIFAWFVEMMGLIGMGNNPMVGATVAVAVSVQQAADEGKF